MKRALVLSGGGSKGSFEVGALQVLFEKGYRFGRISGVSAGALNGVMTAMAHGHSPGDSACFDRLVEIWNTITKEQVYSGSLNWFTAFKLLFGADSIYSNKPLWKLIQAEVTQENLKKIPPDLTFTVGCVDLITGEYIQADSSWSEFAKYVWASTTMPIIWPPVQIGRRLLVDGGVSNISPLGDVLDWEPDEIVVVNCNNHLQVSAYTGKLNNLLKIGERSIGLLTHTIAYDDNENFLEDNYFAKQTPNLWRRNGHLNKYFDCKMIEPEIDLGETLDFSQASIQMRMKHGRDMARKVLA